MATIVFWPHPEPGHIFPTLRLARSLRRRGHRVVYLTIKDHEALIRNQTFECVVLFESIMPLGWVEQLQQLPVDQQLGKYHWSLSREHRAILDGSVAAVVGALAPDVLLIDYFNENMDFVAYKLGIPFIHLFTSKVRIPPPASAAARRWERIVKYYRRIKNLLKGWELRPRNWRTELGRYAGCPNELVDRNLVPPGTRGIAGAPELALWLPELLDDETPGVPGRCHAASVDIERTETGTVPWDDLPAGGPLIYFSLGSQSQRFDSEPIYRSLLAVLASRPDLRAVIHLPKRLSPHLATPDLENVIVLKDNVPQLQVLQRAAAFITHGGLGSVKESIHHGVPMLIIPMSTDQPANAARIERLGLGRACAPHDVTTDTLASLLADVLALHQTTQFTSTIARLRALENGDHGAEFVESIMKRGNAAASARRAADV